MSRKPSALLALVLMLACRPMPTAKRQSPNVNRKPSDATYRLPLPARQLTIKGHKLDAELARLPHERNIGLMYRRELAPDSGMLFVFDREEPQRFWMQNTYVPLAIAFIDRNALITDILEMAPLDTTTPYMPTKPTLYALEMNSGWFQSRGITPGDIVLGIPGR